MNIDIKGMVVGVLCTFTAMFICRSLEPRVTVEENQQLVSFVGDSAMERMCRVFNNEKVAGDNLVGAFLPWGGNGLDSLHTALNIKKWMEKTEKGIPMPSSEVAVYNSGLWDAKGSTYKGEEVTPRDFRRNVRRTLSVLTPGKRLVIVLTTNPVDPDFVSPDDPTLNAGVLNSKIEEFNAILRREVQSRASEGHRIVLVDVWHMVKEERPPYFFDHQHFDDRWYERVASEVAAAISEMSGERRLAKGLLMRERESVPRQNQVVALSAGR